MVQKELRALKPVDFIVTLMGTNSFNFNCFLDLVCLFDSLLPTVIMKHHRTGSPDWPIYLQSDKSNLVTGQTVLAV